MSFNFHLCKFVPQLSILFTILYWNERKYGSGESLWILVKILCHGALTRNGKISVHVSMTVESFCIESTAIQYNALLLTLVISFNFPFDLIVKVLQITDLSFSFFLRRPWNWGSYFIMLKASKETFNFPQNSSKDSILPLFSKHHLLWVLWLF